MKSIISTLAVIFLLCIAITGCKKDKNDTKKNVLKVDGTEYDISKGFLQYYGGNGSVYNIDLNLISSGITVHETLGLPDSASGIGHAIYFEMYTSSIDKLALGDYTYNFSSQAAGSFDYADYILNWNLSQQHNPTFIEITSGTVKVIKSGAEYELSFSGTDKNNKTISGYYKGSLTYYDQSQVKKSQMLKRTR